MAQVTIEKVISGYKTNRDGVLITTPQGQAQPIYEYVVMEDDKEDNRYTVKRLAERRARLLARLQK